MSYVSDPVDDAAEVTPHDTTALDPTPTGLYVGVTGDVTVITARGTTVTFTAVPAGSILPIRVTHVKATGTSATDIVALNGIFI
jgi:hypothetical protein